MRGLFTSAQGFFDNTIHDIRGAVRSHFGNHIGGSISGVHVRLPFTRLSAFIEWRGQSVGLGHEREAGRLEVFAGRLQAVFCVEPSAE